VLVNDLIIVELKSVRQLIEAHDVQLVNYLTATGKPIGLLINFGPESLNVKRKIRELPITARQSRNPVYPVNPV
jgi:GxxExxY protein